MGKSGDPTKLNSWSSSLSTASSDLDTVVADLKAASPYPLGDATFHGVKVTAGTTQVTVGHYSGYNGNQGAPIYKTETKWVTEQLLNQPGIAQNSGSFMTWLPGTVPNFGNTANTWQGYAASMFANLLQDFVNTIEEIKNTVDQLSKELSALATSISDSRKWWKILLEIVLPIVLIFIAVVVNIFFPGLGAAVLTAITTGLRFLGSIVGIVGETAIETGLAAVDLGAFLPSSEEASIIGDIGLDTTSVYDFGDLSTIALNPGDIFPADAVYLVGDVGVVPPEAIPIVAPILEAADVSADVSPMVTPILEAADISADVSPLVSPILEAVDVGADISPLGTPILGAVDAEVSPLVSPIIEAADVAEGTGSETITYTFWQPRGVSIAKPYMVAGLKQATVTFEIPTTIFEEIEPLDIAGITGSIDVVTPAEIAPITIPEVIDGITVQTPVITEAVVENGLGAAIEEDAISILELPESVLPIGEYNVSFVPGFTTTLPIVRTTVFTEQFGNVVAEVVGTSAASSLPTWFWYTVFGSLGVIIPVVVVVTTLKTGSKK